MSSRYLEYRGPQVEKYLRKAIEMRGGVTRFGEPRYRLVLAHERFEQAGGKWHEWDENLGVNDRNYVNRHGQELNKPLRVVEEMRWVPKYPQANVWILEKWLGPENYGARESWPYEQLGAYPEQGDYEATGYEFPGEALTEAIVLKAIGRIEHYADRLPSTMKGRVKRAEYLAKQRDEEKEARLEKRDAEIVADAGFAFGGKSFSASGEKRKSDRDATAEKLGINPGKL